MKNTEVLQRQSENYIKGELSNVATVIQNPQFLCEYFSIDADATTTVDGFKNIEDYIDKFSNVVYNVFDNTPVSGVDNLVSQANWDEEVGFDEDFQSSAVFFPNTVRPKPNDCFVIKDTEVVALYVITAIQPITVRSNPFMEVTFRLLSRDPDMIKQLRRQVKDEYITTVTSIGADKTLTIKKSAYYKMQEHIKDYVALTQMYMSMFYDRARATFLYHGAYDGETNRKIDFLDVTLWKFMFDNRVIIFDDVITYAINNYNMDVAKCFTDCPERYLTDHRYDRSLIARLIAKDKKNDIGEYRYPQGYEEDPRIAKFSGVNTYYLEFYDNICDPNPINLIYPVFDDDFINRIRGNICYDGSCSYDANSVNIGLRNAIINYYNDSEIDFDIIEIEDYPNNENYLLIPILLAIYSRYISSLK